MTNERAKLLGIRAELVGVLGWRDKLLAPTSAAEDLTALQRTKAIEWVLDHSDRPLTPVEIWHSFQDGGQSDRKDFVQVSTNSLAHRGRIEQLGDGRYRSKKTGSWWMVGCAAGGAASTALMTRPSSGPQRA